METERLHLRRPEPADAGAIYRSFAGDPEVTRYLAWPTHRSVEDSLEFVRFSDGQWQQWPGGPYLIQTRTDGAIIGSCGYSFETPYRASVGFVLARPNWGQGVASEVLRALVAAAPGLGIKRLYALCHQRHMASARVLRKGGFEAEARLRRYHVFPNLEDQSPQDVALYARLFA